MNVPQPELYKLPKELIQLIFQSLNCIDYYNMSLVCKRFQLILNQNKSFYMKKFSIFSYDYNHLDGYGFGRILPNRNKHSLWFYIDDIYEPIYNIIRYNNGVKDNVVITHELFEEQIYRIHQMYRNNFSQFFSTATLSIDGALGERLHKSIYEYL
jgi:hypothetical protein